MPFRATSCAAPIPIAAKAAAACEAISGPAWSGGVRLTPRDGGAGAGAGEAVALVEQGRACVAFAVAQPELFRLMFGPALAKGRAGRWGEGAAAVHVLLARVGALVPAAERDLASLHSWAIVYGLACLALDGQIETDPGALDAAEVGVLSLASRALPRGAAAQNGIDAPSQA